MVTTRIKKGLTVPIAGSPEQTIGVGSRVTRVALLGVDYPGMRPTMAMAEGDAVKRGQVLFADKKTDGVVFTAPAGGVISSINRGSRRRFESITIEIASGTEEEEAFLLCESAVELANFERSRVEDNLVASGLWTALRTRPYSRIPAPGTAPVSIFVTAIDTTPLAPDPAVVIASGSPTNSSDFRLGQAVLTRLTEGPVFVCQAPEADIPILEHERVEAHAFAGPHPAGLAGTHIHFIDPVQAGRTSWFIGYQDVIAFGSLFRTGRLNVDRVVSIAGPAVKIPRLVRTRLGADIGEVVDEELTSKDDVRILSGDVLSGHAAEGFRGFLGRYHRSVCALPLETDREFLNWMRPGFGKYSIKPAFAGSLRADPQRAMNTSANGSPRAMVPIGMYEKIMPLDILPTFLLRALTVGDDEQAEALGCLELDEEDLALCSFVCPGKTEYGPLLRTTLTRLEKEGHVE